MGLLSVTCSQGTFVGELGQPVSEVWEAWLSYSGVGEERDGRSQDSECWRRPTRDSRCKTPGKLELLKSMEEKPN